MKLRGTAEELVRTLRAKYPQAELPRGVKAQMLPYQMLALYGLALQFDRPEAQILEIGSGFGASGLILAQAAPRAQIVSLTPNAVEASIAQAAWRRGGYQNIYPMVTESWTYHAQATAITRDMVFVDGDHNQIRRDMVWWNSLRQGGLMLFHDYSPADSTHPSPPVYSTLNAWRDKLKRDFDVLVVDDEKTGLAGWYRWPWEVWA